MSDPPCSAEKRFLTPFPTTGNRPRLLLLACSCSPDRGSEPGVGWHRALQAARYCDTWVICSESHGPAVREHLQRHGEYDGVKFVFVAKTGVAKSIANLPGMYYASYRLWHRAAFKLAQNMHRELGFDLVHQVTLCGYREPGYLWKLGVPFIWGPVGGTQNYPTGFLAEAGLLAGSREALRGVGNFLQLRWGRRIRVAARSAAALLAANSTIQQHFEQLVGIRPLLQLETGLARVEATARRRRDPREPFRILWSGNLEAWKACSLLIKALAQLPRDLPYEVRILGEGRLKNRWQRLARRRGVERHMRWLGHLPYREALRQNEWADVMVFTSLRDTSGNVLLEALANGLPVICLDHQGARDIVTRECGIKVRVTRPGETIAGLARAIEHLAREGDVWERLSAGAIERAREYLWDAQGERMAQVYARVLAANNKSLMLTQAELAGQVAAESDAIVGDGAPVP